MDSHHVKASRMQEWPTPRRLRRVGFALFGIWGALSSMYPGQHFVWLAVLGACFLASVIISKPIRKR